jgi:hypothetical protein
MNKGRKYLYYTIIFTDQKKGISSKQVCLSDILENTEFEKNLPHIVGFFKDSIDTDRNVCPAYLEIRRIGSIEDFWKFLNDTDI